MEELNSGLKKSLFLLLLSHNLITLVLLNKELHLDYLSMQHVII